MEKNYYDILEVNKNASKEIIDKAYKTLIKKYHPDLQDNDLKIEYENKLKKINEAYETLSDQEKRKKYNLILKNTEISPEKYNKLYNENIALKNEINYLKNNYNIFFKEQKINNSNINKKINNAINAKYYDAYIQNFKNKKYKKKSKDFIAFFITILIILIISLILWNIPFTKNYLINSYNENSILKFLVDLFINLFK